MILTENFRVAARALWANKMRSVLTTLGIIIGVAAVVAVVSIVQGLQHLVTNQIQDLGANFVAITPRQQFTSPGMVAKPVRLTWEDGQAIQEQVRGVEMITPQILGTNQLKYRDRTHSAYVLGVNSEWPVVNNYAVDTGRFFSRLDLDRRQKVAVVGRNILEELRLTDAIGREIYVANLPVTVVGVMEEKGRALGFDYDDMVFVPFDTALSIFGRRAAEQVQLQLRTHSSGDVERVKEEVTRLLRTRHRIAEGDPDDFQVLLQDEILDIYTQILGGVTAVVGGIVSIALLVGGIGIMNIMLVSVTERTREIGIRKSVGARRRDILFQFLIESVALSLVGGAIGLALGWALGAAATQLIPGDLPPAYIPVWAVVLAFGFSTLVGTFFGIYPAGKAAGLDPIEALRYE